MDERQISTLVSHSDVLQDAFRGIFKRDGLVFLGADIPTGCYIINTSNILPGQHWIAVHKMKEEIPFCVFFDPLGYGAQHYHIEIAGHSVLYNEMRVQSSESTTCALYCLFFLHGRSIGLNMLDIMQCFHSDVNRNEEIVLDFARSLLADQLQ